MGVRMNYGTVLKSTLYSGKGETCVIVCIGFREKPKVATLLL